MTLYAVNLYKLRQFNKKSSGDGEMNPAIRMMILLMQSLTLLNLVCYLPFGCYINAVAFGHGNEIISHTMQYALVTHPFVTIKGLGHFIALEYVYHFNNPFKREDTVRESSFNMQPIFVPYPDAEAQEIEGVTPTNNHRYTF
ncbi:hypothetical protein HK103_005447 [Boothiomyces macroporosus]|uniref:Uncharacterized protein n=1 Tax=Boothiomyces macroporosus TaxID=261099 RepID=A0AAD5Y890_9FUNG|nr:hypothetical protein HK103_005447 [Boothiomyces macroporosus]